MTILNERAAAPGHTLIKWLGYSLCVLTALLVIASIGRQNDGLNIVLLAAPAVIFAILLLAPQAFVMTTRGKQVRMLNVFMALPILVMVGTSFGAGVLDVKAAFVPAALCAAITLLLGLGLAARRLPGSLAAGLIFFGLYGAAYGYGAMILADTRLDHAEGQSFESQVVRRYVGGGRSTTYHLVLAPWGPVTRQDNAGVPRALYDQTQLGQTVCVTLHPGLLRMPWRSIAACPAA